MSVFKAGSAKKDIAGERVSSIRVEKEKARPYTRLITCGASKTIKDLVELETRGELSLVQITRAARPAEECFHPKLLLQ